MASSEIITEIAQNSKITVCCLLQENFFPGLSPRPPPAKVNMNKSLFSHTFKKVSSYVNSCSYGQIVFYGNSFSKSNNCSRFMGEGKGHNNSYIHLVEGCSLGRPDLKFGPLHLRLGRPNRRLERPNRRLGT